MTVETDTPEVLWRPDPAAVPQTEIAKFGAWVREHRGVDVDGTDWASVHEWSVTDLDGFWSAVAEYSGVLFHDAPTATLGSREMPGAEWFPGSTLNYAEHVLTPGPGRADGDVAIEFVREDGLERTIAYFRRQLSA